MIHYSSLGKSFQRKEALEKVTGAAKYTGDFSAPGLLYAKMVTSPHAHARIRSIDTSAARRVSGVRAIVTGKNYPYLTGSEIYDRPPIAVHKVRYHGEPVVVVVADNEAGAKRASELIKVEYEALPVVNSPGEAVQSGAPLVHEGLRGYKHSEDVYPEPDTNIANRTRIRKGDMEKGWMESEVNAEASFSFNQSDHVATETRACTVEILPDGKVIIHSSSQSPFLIKKWISTFFGIDLGKVIVIVPFVGGAYGGKTPVQLEPIAYLASKAVGGRMVKLVNTREEDMITSPVHIGLEARVKLGSTKDGRLKAVKITYLLDGGAYSDRAIIISRAAAVDCTGPYKIENVWCDSLCMYTNHPPATAFRGFGHSELTFVMERTMDILADKLNIDPLELRLMNAIVPGDTTPTQAPLNESKVGNLTRCLGKLRELIDWDEEERVKIDDRKVRAKGVSCFWKTSVIPPGAGSGVVLTFNKDGSINLNCGVVEFGQASKTALAQILAERMDIDVDQIHVVMKVNTEVSPEHWKTVASRTTLMAGNAVLNAADDAKAQLYKTAAVVLRCSEDDIEIGGGRVFLKDDPDTGIDIKDIAHGYRYPNGNVVGEQVIGRGSYTLKGLTELDPETGKGIPGPEWTVGAQAVEVEFDTRDFTYQILKAATVIDQGKVINPAGAREQMTGGMCMGLSFASRESFLFTDEGLVRNPMLRTYKVMRFGENPEYLVDFVETPDLEAPYGARGIGEFGVIGMPAALANSLSKAAEVPLNRLPLFPELIWRTKKGI